MAYPLNVKTRLVSFGGAATVEAGIPLHIRISTESSRSLIWVENGYRLESLAALYMSATDGQEIIFEVPTTDQNGWLDAATRQAIIVEPGEASHLYTTKLEIFTEDHELIRTYEIGPYAVPEGSGTLDADLLNPDYDPIEGTLTTYIPGPEGASGASGTIESATAIGLAAGADPTVTLGGTPNARTFIFGIPKGEPGSGSVNSVNGDTGPDVVLDAADVGAVPDTQFATQSSRGIVELATDAEVIAGTDTQRAVTPSSLKFVSGTDAVMADASVGDGIQDARPALQAALNAGEGGEVRIPPGVYLIKTGRLDLPSNTRITMSPTTVIKRGSTGDVLMINKTNGQGGWDGAENITIIGGILDGNAGEFASNHSLLAFGHSRNIRVEDVTFRNLAGNWHMLECNSTDNGQFVGCRFDGMITASTSTEMAQVDLCASAAFPWFGPYDNQPCRNITFDRCDFKNASCDGIGTHTQVSGKPHTDIKIVSCSFEEVRTATKPLHWSGVLFKGNTVLNCYRGFAHIENSELYPVGVYRIIGNSITLRGTVGQERGISVCAGKYESSVVTRLAKGVIISGNSVDNSGQYGIGCDWGEYITIVGNVVSGYGKFAGATGRVVGIWVYNGQSATVADNMIYGGGPEGGGGSAVIVPLQVGATSGATTAVQIIGNRMIGAAVWAEVGRAIATGNDFSAAPQILGTANVQEKNNFIGGAFTP